MALNVLIHTHGTMKVPSDACDVYKLWHCHLNTADQNIHEDSYNTDSHPSTQLSVKLHLLKQTPIQNTVNSTNHLEKGVRVLLQLLEVLKT